MPETALAVRDLRIELGETALVNGVSFELAAGERVGLIGESGSGKSLTALAVMGLLPEELRASGSARSTRATSSRCRSGSSPTCAATGSRWSSRSR